MQKIKQKNVYRKSRIESVLYKAIAKIFMEDKICNKDVLISKVNLSADLKAADVFITSLSQENRDSILTEIKKVSYLIYKFLLDDVSLRRMPKLNFKLDKSFDNSSHIN